MSAPGATSQRQPGARLSAEQFRWLRDTLATFAGVFLDDGQLRVLEAAITQRMAALDCERDAYIELLRAPGSQAELQLLIELVLNHETFFFRNRPHLRALQEVLLPELHRRKPAGLPIRIWSAGCSTGEEPYSIALAALEALGAASGRPVEIIATDLSGAALRRAEAGRYRGRTLQNLTQPQLQRYFVDHGDTYEVAPALRSLVRFRRMNLLEPFPDAVQRVDAIFCQNVTIYFRAEARRQLIERFYGCLPQGGLLFLGFSETLWNVFDGFRSREISGAYVYVKEPPAGAPEAARPRQLQPRAPQSPRARRAEAAPRSAPAVEGDHLRAARALIRDGRPGEVLDELRHIAPDSPSALEALMLAARAHADRGDLDLAAAEALRVIEADTLHDGAYQLLGIVYAREGQWPLAIQQLERARYLQPDSPLTSFHLAEAYREHGQIEQAQREYHSTIWKLRDLAEDHLLDGVAVAWLRETCRRQIERLGRAS